MSWSFPACTVERKPELDLMFRLKTMSWVLEPCFVVLQLSPLGLRKCFPKRNPPNCFPPPQFRKQNGFFVSFSWDESQLVGGHLEHRETRFKRPTHRFQPEHQIQFLSPFYSACRKLPRPTWTWQTELWRTKKSCSPRRS